MRPYYIVSPCKSSNSETENKAAIHYLEQFFWKANIENKPVSGVYQGIREQSYIIYNERLARIICKKYEQECYFAVNENNQASLKNSDGQLLQRLGEALIGKEKPDTICYTYLPDSKEYLYTE